MNSQAMRSCPICEEVACEVLHRQEFILPEGHPLETGYNVVCCACCGFVYADSSATQNDYDLFYAQHSKYDHGATASGGGDSTADARRLRATAEEIARLLPDRHARVLDVGCASGGLLRFLREFGFDNLHGLDPSPRCAAQASSHGSIHIGGLGHLPSDLGSFDLVILSHVLEHVLQFGAALRSLAGLLISGGLLYLEVPDATRYLEYYVTPFHYFDIEHINHFSPSTLARALNTAGYAEISSGTKQIPLTDSVDYPACWVVGINSPGDTRIWARDEALVKAVRRYIEISNTDFNSQLVEDLDRSGRSIIVWGIGCSTTRLLASSPLGEANIRAFVDNDPATWGQMVHGREVISPASLQGCPEPIVITSKLYGEDIYRQIRDELRLPNEVVLLYRNESASCPHESTIV